MFSDFLYGNASFLDSLVPEQILELPTATVVRLIEQKYKVSLELCTTPNQIPSPVAQESDTQWLKSANIVGINVRTIGNFWQVVKYALSLPKSQDSIHLLPIWECGVVKSLYGMASWQLNPEFFSDELAAFYPSLNTVEKQLPFVINILHLMGKTVGMDVIPHTDRYAEQVLAQPHFFEWLQREDTQIVRHDTALVNVVKDLIWQFVQQEGTANGEALPPNELTFFEETPEAERLCLLFGQPDAFEERKKRRNALIQRLYDAGLEPVPATMAPPYRGLTVDTSPTALTIDSDGRRWRDFLITAPMPFSRVFNPLARYQFHAAKNQNTDWELDFEAPRKAVFDYVATHYAEVALGYGFDYMRGDMAHVQMRPEGVPAQADPFYDILGYIKTQIRQQKPYFASFAEAFIAPDNVMGYGNEMAHLAAAQADTVLGDLQSVAVNNIAFQDTLQYYLDLATQHTVKPCLTLMTADKDDPRFDEFYWVGNEIRMFLGLFWTDLPSYMALGFETRDVHYTPAPNEHYTKLYVFQEEQGEKAVHGAYQWGKNRMLWQRLTEIRHLADEILPKIKHLPLICLQQLSSETPQLIWTHQNSPYRFSIDFATLSWQIDHNEQRFKSS